MTLEEARRRAGSREAPALGAPAGSSFRRWLPGLVLAGVLLVALAPSLGTLGAPLVSEDATLLGHAHRSSAWPDWLRPQGGLSTLRFWRPLVSLSWDVQEAWTGTRPAPLRAYNLACHLAAALLLALLARRLGAGWLGALAAGAMGASFPDQGGTLTWISGRTDGTCSPLLVAALLALAWERPLAAALLAFFACAAKEMAFVLPAFAVACAWAGPEEGRGGRRRAAVGLTLGVGVAFVWRRLALGSWIGGYPVAPGGALAGLGTGLATWGRACAPSLVAALLALPLGLALGLARPRLWAAGLACALAGALPLLPMLSGGVLEATNVRTLRVSDLGLALAVAGGLAGTCRALLAPLARAARLSFALAALAALVGWREVRAFGDTHEWADSGRAAQHEIDLARARVAREPASPDPILGAGFPPTWHGAYCLAYGIADRFRAPFPVAPRPVWPLRRMFPVDAGERGVLRRGAGRWHDPFSDPWPEGLARIELGLPAGAVDGAVPVDETALHEPDRSPVLEVRGSFPGTAFELVLWTELGYEPVPWPVPAEAGSRALSVRRALLCSGRVSLGEALALTADLGARRAYLEVRAVAPGGRVVAASDWVPLSWDADLLEHVPR